jgi:hypothetical protein
MQQQPDMAQFEAEFNQQAEAGHVHSAACEHHHVDAFIDRPEDHIHEPTESHGQNHEHAEAHHDHSEHGGHVHGPGCGHVGHEQAHEHIDCHIHSEGCGHLHHGEAKERVDHGHDYSKHHQETEHEHAEGHVDKPHVHDANCGHLHHHEAEAHVDHTEKPKHEAHDHDHSSKHVHHPGCGHVGFEHADHTVRHEHERHHVPETVKQEELAAPHATPVAETARHKADLYVGAVQEQVARSIETEQHIIQTVESEPIVRPEVVEANVREEQQRQIIKTMEALTRDSTDAVEQIIERSPDEGVVTQNEAITPFSVESGGEAALVPAEIVAEADPVLETGIVEQLDEAPELYEVMALSEKPAEIAEAYSELMQGVEAILTPELAAKDVVELEITTPDLAGVEAGETPNFTTDGLLADVDAIQETPELEATAAAAAEQMQPVMQEALTDELKPEQPVSENEPEIAKEAPEFAAIEEQFKMLAETASDQKPEVLSELHKSIANLYAALHDGTGEINTEKMSQEFLRLLTLLGFERPGETLQMYVQRYSISVMDTMLARLFELLCQSLSMETVTPTLPLFTALPPDPQGTQTIGKTVLALLTKLHRVQRQELALVA